jgi:hypothetical protein
MELDFIKLLTKENYESGNIVIGTVTGKFLENDLGSFTNPLLIIPSRTIGAFVKNSTYNSLNPYPLRLDISKYYFYHKYIDVIIIDLNHDELERDRFMVAERFPNTHKYTGKYKIYQIN